MRQDVGMQLLPNSASFLLQTVCFLSEKRRTDVDLFFRRLIGRMVNFSSRSLLKFWSSEAKA